MGQNSTPVWNISPVKSRSSGTRRAGVGQGWELRGDSPPSVETQYDAGVKIGTRLTIVLLVFLLPVLATYAYWSVHRSANNDIDDLKRGTRTITLGLAPSVESRHRCWRVGPDPERLPADGRRQGAERGVQARWPALGRIAGLSARTRHRRRRSRYAGCGHRWAKLPGSSTRLQAVGDGIAGSSG